MFFSKKDREKSLISACRKGKRSAQKELYEKYNQKMFGVCLGYVKNDFEAEDVLMKAFMKVFDKIDTFKEAGSFEGWIRRIVVNEALGHIRKYHKIKNEEIEKADYEGHFSSNNVQLEADDLMKLVNALPIGYKTVFNLYAIEGYSHKEIAEKLEITESTSKSQLNRARKALKKSLEEENEFFFEQRTA